MKKIFFGLIIIIIQTNFCVGQILYNNIGHLPQQYQVDWYNGGLLDDNIKADHFIDVTQATGTDDADKLKNAIIQAKSNCGITLIYFPVGNY